MPRFKCSRQGFNLIELMVVVAIVGVIAGISSPSIFRYVNSNRLQTQADRLAADLQYTRSLSISTATILRFTSTPTGYQVTNPVNGDMGLGIAQTSDFFPWGMADPNVFNITNATGTITVNLMPTGIVEVQ